MNPVSTTGRGYILSALCVVVVTGLFWIGYGCEWDRMYSPSPFHRLQAAAILNGHLALSRTIENIDWDLAWHDGAANHVWGLGVGIWVSLFELVFRCCGGRELPDRIPLLVAIALLSWYVSRTALVVAREVRSWRSGALYVYLTLLFPPLWNLILGYKLVYEDTVLYATILAVALLSGMIRTVLLGRFTDFYIVCGLSAISALVRPTFAVYGVLASLLSGVALLLFHVTERLNGSGRHTGLLSRPTDRVASLSALANPVRMFDRNISVKRLRMIVARVVSGWVIVLSGFVFLAYTNYIRFGSVWEFGHRLTVSGDMIIYATRFNNPFAQVGLADAGKELFSWIFLSPFHQPDNWSGRNVLPWVPISPRLPWQANCIRWRNIYQPTFDPTWLILCFYGTVAGVGFLRRGICKIGWKGFLRSPLQSLIGVLLLWFTAASTALVFFYLRFPTLSTRYILDFSPAFLGVLVVAMLIAGLRLPTMAIAVSVLWLVGEQSLLFFYRGVGELQRQAPFSFSDRPQLPTPHGRRLVNFGGQYSVGQHPNQTGIWGNGYGWHLDGFSTPVVTLMVDRPKFLEVVLAKDQIGSEESSAPIVCRVKIDNQELNMESLTQETRGTNLAVRIRLSIPEKIRRQNNDELVSLCFAKSAEELELMKLRQLYEVRWR